MTCIVGVDLGDRVVIAADQRVMCGPEPVNDRHGKLFRVGKWLYGLSGTAAAQSALRRAATSLADAKTLDDFEAAVAAALRAADFHCEPQGGGPKSVGTSLLATSGDGLALLFSDGGHTLLPVGQPVACGSGAEYALGYLSGVPPTSEQALRGAVLAAIRWNAYCGGEPQVEVVQRAVSDVEMQQRESWRGVTSDSYMEGATLRVCTAGA